MVVTGDVTQVDLPGGTQSGLRVVRDILDRRSRTCTSPSCTGIRRRAAPARRGIVDAYGRWDEKQPQGPAPVSIDVLNETDVVVDELELVACARYVLEQMRVHPQAELCLRLVDEAAMETLHVQWMDLPGPTDVMAFPMDELRPGREGSEPQEGVLGDVVLCPRSPRSRPARPATRPRRSCSCSRPTASCTCSATTTPTPEEEKEMFELQRQLLLTFLATRGRPSA